MSRLFIGCLVLVLLLSDFTFAVNIETPEKQHWSGAWDVEVEFATGRSGGLMEIEARDGELTGTSQPLGENKFYPLQITGRFENTNAEIILSYRDEQAGSFIVERFSNKFAGNGSLFGIPVSVTAVKTPRSYRAPVMHQFAPETFTTQFTTNIDPVLSLVPGDSVATFTLDNEGRNHNRNWVGMPGNTLTGPFYIEGALPGDTLVVRLKKITINRDTAKMYSATLNQKAVEGGHIQKAEHNWGRVWNLDRSQNTASLEKPSDKLKNFKLPIEPMLGSIGVAPPLNQALFAGDVGFHGGNLDYNRFVEGTTIYLPVWQSGAYLFLGDGHALQGDGEISGQGLETSLDVEFEIDLIKGKSLRQVWSENDEYIMISGVENTLDSSLQMATSGMSRWLKENYGLNDSEIATVLSATIEYDIAEVVDPRPHVVAKIRKSVLGMLKK